MKPKPSPSLPKQRAKRAKAVLMWATRSDAKHNFYIHEIAHTSKPSTRVTNLDNTPIKPSPVAVLPVRTHQQARQLVRWHNKTYAQKVEAMGEAMAFGIYAKPGMWKKLMEATRESWRNTARAILNLLGESPDPEN